ANGKTVWANDDASAAITTLRGAQELATTMHDAAYTLEYTQIVPTPRSPHVGQQRVHMRDVLVDHANEESGAALEEALNHHATLVGEIRSMGGAIADVPQEAPLGRAVIRKHFLTSGPTRNLSRPLTRHSRHCNRLAQEPTA